MRQTRKLQTNRTHSMRINQMSLRCRRCRRRTQHQGLRRQHRRGECVPRRRQQAPRGNQRCPPVAREHETCQRSPSGKDDKYLSCASSAYVCSHTCRCVRCGGCVHGNMHSSSAPVVDCCHGSVFVCRQKQTPGISHARHHSSRFALLAERTCGFESPGGACR